MDALKAAKLVQEFTESKPFEAFESDVLLRSGVERQFQIVGDALNRLSQIDPETAAKVPDLHAIVGFRNVIVHAYDSVDAAIVWRTVVDKVPTLVETSPNWCEI